MQNNMHFMKIQTLAIICTIFLISSCATNPVTGRSQLNTIPEETLFPQSFAIYNETLSKEKISTNAHYNQQVKRVGKRIQAAVEKFFNDINRLEALKNYRWEYKVVENKELNAWCLPGGKVAFYTGILPICQDDQGIAVVMGHEIAHAIANHGAERMSQSGLISGIGQLGGEALGVSGMNSNTQNLILQAYGVGSQVGILSYSRKHESEADEMGLLFMALAGYDPAAAPAFWKRMAAANSSASPPEFLSTHPHSSTRIADLNAMLPIAEQVYISKSIEPYFKAKSK